MARKVIWVLSSSLLLLGVAGAQSAPELAAGTKFKVELQGSLDSKKAKVGDKVTAKVLDNVKADGTTVLSKNMMLTGRVTEVVPAEGKAEADMGVLFDQAKPKKGAAVPLRAGIINIIPVDNNTQGALASMSTPAEMGGGGGSGVGTTGGSIVAVAVSGTYGGSALDSNGNSVRFSLQETASDSSHDLGGVINSPKGNVHLDDGTHLELQVLKPISQ